MTYVKSDIKAFGFCDIIFVLFTRRSRISRGYTAYRIVDISLVLCTNIAEAHFLTECASKPSFILFHYGAVGVEQGQLFQIDQILSVLGIALCQHSHTACDDAAGLFHQGFQGKQALAGGDHVVHD